MNKKRSYRKKRDEDEEDDIDVSASIDDRKELQKFRSRPKGVSVEVLASLLDTVSQNKEKTNDDPFKLNSGGGLVDNGKSRDLSNFGTNFSTETNQRDEDKQLLKYIEEGLMKKRGVNQQENPDTKVLSKEDLLYQLPENLKVQSKIMKSEEMLSSQVLCGIPEVDLGIEAKIKNIEATEEAKMKMIEESKNRKQQASEFVPTNMASNFMHHSRFYDEKKAIEKEKKEEKERLENAVVVDKGPTVGGDIIENVEDSKFIRNTMSSGGKRNKKGTSDDFMFESFKKRAREGKWR
ncbi:splicing factor C9orf78 homolog [Hydra vulgaris]|uniref:Splicing factor C9orf78 homolog n=1 Tax=Hydra vulgaris TaxID=6087 RepID=A0ABM4BEN6_HYDVU